MPGRVGVLLTVMLCLTAGACSSGPAVTTSTSQVRADYESALARWEQARPSEYTLFVYYAGTSVESRIVDGQVVSTDVTEGTIVEADTLPVTVEGLFDVVVRILVGAEENPPSEDGECDGRYVSATFDPDLGHPVTIDGASPCEDAAAFSVELRR